MLRKFKDDTKLLSVRPPMNLAGSNEWNYYVKDTPIYSIEIYNHQNVFVTNSGVCFDRFVKLVPGSFMYNEKIK
ncbi:MAG TPA: hypothetical protein VF622_01275, partial [Segetibacter sp.]